MVGHPGPIIISKGSWIKEGEKCLDMHSPKKGEKKSKMGKVIKVREQFSPWKLALLIGLYIVIVYS